MDELTFQHWVRGLPSPTAISRKRAEEIVGAGQVDEAVKAVIEKCLVGVALETEKEAVLIVRPEPMARVMADIETGRLL